MNPDLTSPLVDWQGYFNLSISLHIYTNKDNHIVPRLIQGTDMYV